LFLEGVLGARDGDGKRGQVGGPAGLSLDEPRNNPIELFLQGLEFGRSLRRKSLDEAIRTQTVGDDQAEGLTVEEVQPAS
jgi:hypothetical protein